jgi:phosphoglycolate phosphatase-like HAD superfamily hydrolase
VIAAPWVAGAREFLEAHHRSLAFFVASGTPDDELKMIIARRAMQGYFRSVHGSPATKHEIIGRLLARHGFAPGQMLVVGDALADLEGAAGNDVPFVGRVPAGSASPFPPGTRVIADLHALPALVGI